MSAWRGCQQPAVQLPKQLPVCLRGSAAPQPESRIAGATEEPCSRDLFQGPVPGTCSREVQSESILDIHSSHSMPCSKMHHDPGCTPPAAGIGGSSAQHKLHGPQHAPLGWHAGTIWCASSTHVRESNAVCLACWHAEQHVALLSPGLHHAMAVHQVGAQQVHMVAEAPPCCDSPCSRLRH